VGAVANEDLFEFVHVGSHVRVACSAIIPRGHQGLCLR
jgi:hypothetical protein